MGKMVIWVLHKEIFILNEQTQVKTFSFHSDQYIQMKYYLSLDITVGTDVSPG